MSLLARRASCLPCAAHRRAAKRMSARILREPTRGGEARAADPGEGSRRRRALQKWCARCVQSSLVVCGVCGWPAPRPIARRSSTPMNTLTYTLLRNVRRKPEFSILLFFYFFSSFFFLTFFLPDFPLTRPPPLPPCRRPRSARWVVPRRVQGRLPEAPRVGNPGPPRKKCRAARRPGAPATILHPAFGGAPSAGGPGLGTGARSRIEGMWRGAHVQKRVGLRGPRGRLARCVSAVSTRSPPRRRASRRPRCGSCTRTCPPRSPWPV